jgi:hypothetical protein
VTPEHPRKRGDLEVAEAAGGIVIHDTGRGRVHYLNPIAMLIYELCDGETAVGDIARLLAETYGPQPELEEQVARYVSLLRNEQLVT